MRLLAKEPNVHWMSHTKLFVAISAAMILVSIVSMVTRGVNFGIDFAGGYELQVKFDKHVEEEKVQKVVESLGLGESRVQRYGADDSDEFLVLVRQHAVLSEEQRTQMKHDMEALAGGEAGVGNFSVAESGENVIVGFLKPVDEAQVRAVVAKYGLEVKQIKVGERTDRPEYVIELNAIADKVQAALVQAFDVPADHPLVQRVEFVGPQVGAQLRNQGFLAVVYAMIFILFYIALRFDFYFAPGAIGTIIHDAIITVGFFSIFQIEFNLPIVAAILTLVGYSLNDTIIIFDRVRENMVRLRGRELKSLVDSSINQTLARTLITSGSTLAVVLALLFFGGSVTRDFALCMAVGIVLGTYSTVAISAPLYVLLRQRSMKGGASVAKKGEASAKSPVNGQAAASL
jgi:preprotein translocase subunit SecF